MFEQILKTPLGNVGPDDYWSSAFLTVYICFVPRLSCSKNTSISNCVISSAMPVEGMPKSTSVTVSGMPNSISAVQLQLSTTIIFSA